MELSGHTNHTLTFKEMEPFSEIIIDTLKNLAAKQQQLTPFSLSEALTVREDFSRLLQERRDGAWAPPMGRMTSTLETDSPGTLIPTQPWSDQFQPTSNDYLNLSEDSLELCLFLKKSVLTLIALAQGTENTTLSASLEEFRSLILESTEDLQALETSFQKIKNSIIQEEPGGSVPEPRTERRSFFRSLWQRQSKQTQSNDASQQTHQYLQQLQSVFLTIANQLQFGLGDGYMHRFSELRQRFESSLNLDALIVHADDLIRIIGSYITDASQERDEVANFVKELGKNLLEMESSLLTSLNHTEEAYKLNSDFNDSLHSQLDDINDSFSINKKLDEIRGFVISKLKTIKSALESKRIQDEESLQVAKKEMGSLQKSFQEIKEEVDQIQKKTKILEQEMLLDTLTGIYNRRAYELRIKEELSRLGRYKQPFSVIVFDIDHFKKVNDNYGHLAGDKCLLEITRRIKMHLRHCDFLARYGGDEFIIILPNTIGDDAHSVAEKVRKLIEKTRFLYKGQEVPVTISLGLTEATMTDKEPGVLFVRADAAMYEAKKGGRNRTNRA